MVGRGSYDSAGEKKAVMNHWGSMDSLQMSLVIGSESETYLSGTGHDSNGQLS
jgi:hypothetical protein